MTRLPFAAHLNERLAKVWPLALWLGTALVVGGWFTFGALRERDEELHKAEDHAVTLVELGLAQTARIFEGTELALETAAIIVGKSSDWDLRAHDRTTWRILHDIGKRQAAVPRLIAVDPQGIVRINGEEFGCPPVSVSDRAYFRFHRDTASPLPYVGDPIVGRFSKAPALTLTLRLNRSDGSFDGVVGANISPDKILGHFATLAEPEGVIISLFREDGTLLLRHPEVPSVIGTRFDPFVLTPGANALEGTVRKISPVDGVERITSFKRLDRFGLVLVAGVTVDRALAPWRQRTFDTALLLIVGGGLLSVLYVLLLRRRSERQRSEAAIRESRARLIEVQAIAQLGHYVYDMVEDRWESSEILDVIFGIGPDYRRDAQGWLDLVVPDQRAVMQTYLAEIVSGLHDFDKEYRIRRQADGVERWVAGLGRVERDGTGRALRMLGTIRDVTDKNVARLALQAKAEELARSNADLEQFAYVASHDLREPLRMVSSYMRLLERRYADRLDADALEFIGFAREGAVRMNKLVLDLLAYSRVGRLVDDPVPVPLGPVIDVALRHLGSRIAETGAEIVVTADLPTVTGHAEDLGRLFQNLIDNAIKYRAPDRLPQIRISARAVDGQWVVSVADNGIGIGPDYFERIFVIFQRLHRHPDYEGTGIGLAICKKVVERHGGRIWVESVVGEGSTFHVALPRG